MCPCLPAEAVSRLCLTPRSAKAPAVCPMAQDGPGSFLGNCICSAIRAGRDVPENRAKPGPRQMALNKLETGDRVTEHARLKIAMRPRVTLGSTGIARNPTNAADRDSNFRRRFRGENLWSALWKVHSIWCKGRQQPAWRAADFSGCEDPQPPAGKLSIGCLQPSGFRFRTRHSPPIHCHGAIGSRNRNLQV